MRPFIVDDNIKEQFAELVTYAEAHPFSTSQLIKIIEGEAKPPSAIKGYNLAIPFGYHVILTMEKQVDGRVARHLSVSVPMPGKLPNPAVVQEMMKLTGFTKRMEECLIEMESIGKGHDSVSVVEVISKEAYANKEKKS